MYVLSTTKDKYFSSLSGVTLTILSTTATFAPEDIPINVPSLLSTSLATSKASSVAVIISSTMSLAKLLKKTYTCSLNFMCPGRPPLAIISNTLLNIISFLKNCVFYILFFSENQYFMKQPAADLQKRRGYVFYLG